MKNSILIIICLVFSFKTYCQPVTGNNNKTFFNQNIPSDSAVLFAKDIVSYPFMNHSSVSTSKNMDEIYWSKWYDDEGREEIVFSKKINEQWTEPKKASFSGVYSDDVPFISPDGTKLFFLSRRPINPDSRSTKENIWSVERLDDQSWSEPIPLSMVINSKQLHWQFSVAGNGNIYFSTDEGIKLSKYINGEYKNPVLISEELNPKYTGGHPFISPDETYIIFASGNLEDSFGSNDLYIGYKDSKGNWSDPINLGNLINREKGEMCPMVSADKKYLFFVRYDDVFNVYWVKADFIDNLNPYKK